MQFFRIVLGVGIGYLVLTLPGFWAVSHEQSSSPIYLFTGFALVCALHFGLPALLALFLAPVLLVGLILLATSHPITSAILIQAVGTSIHLVFAAALGSALVRKTMGDGWRTLTTETDVLRFFFWGGVVGYLPSPFLTVTASSLAGTVPPDGMVAQWLAYYIGGVYGIFVMAPLTLMALFRREPIWHARTVLIGIPLAISAVIILATFSLVHRWEIDSIRARIQLQGSEILEQLADRATVLETALMGEPSAATLRTFPEIVEVRPLETASPNPSASDNASTNASPTFELRAGSKLATIDLAEFIKAASRGHLTGGLVFSLELSSGRRLFFESPQGPLTGVSPHAGDTSTRVAEPLVGPEPSTTTSNGQSVITRAPVQQLEFRRGNEIFRVATYATDAYWKKARRYLAGQVTGVLWLLVTALLVLAFGLTGRKTLIQNKDQELLTQRERLLLADNVMQNTSEAIAVLDSEGALVSVNPAFTKITGFLPQEVLGRRLASLRSQHHSKGFFSDIFDHLEKHATWSGEIWGVRKDQGGFAAFHTISVVRDRDGKITNYIDAFSDITDRKQEQAQIEFLAFNDALTRLPNRVVGYERLSQAISHAKRSGCKTAALYIDVDHFKLVNDTYGHAAGDALLRGVATRLRDALRQEDTLCRLSGDEFLIVLYEVSDPGAVVAICEKIRLIMNAPFTIDDRELVVTLSIGAALYPDDGDNTDRLLQHADIALNEVKKRSRNNYRLYSMDLSESLTLYVDTARGLRQAIDRNEFQLVYQPQVNLETGRVVGIESLVRWKHPERGLLSPSEFIAVAEESGLIAPLGEWILRQACLDAARWAHQGLAFGTISVNMSALQFDRADPIDLIMQALRQTGLPTTQLDVEITESVMVKNVERMAAHLTVLKHLGIGVSIDDFGIGYSSLSYLKKLSVDRIKIDQSFVASLDSDRSNQALVKAIIDMAHSLGIRAVAEGIETEEVLKILKAARCDEGQGYWFARPMSAEDLEVYLATRSG